MTSTYDQVTTTETDDLEARISIQPAITAPRVRNKYPSYHTKQLSDISNHEF